VKIGGYVQQHINQIFNNCDDKQLNSLLEKDYSRETFKIGYAFCIEIDRLQQYDSKRYWKEIYNAKGKQVRVCSQWYERHKPYFEQYLTLRNIARNSNPSPNEPQKVSGLSNSRYKDYAIGNAQNLFIRNILGKIGCEAFTKSDWDLAKDFFGLKCAYCDTETDLIMDHAIPINKEQMGEHRLGNLVPSCKSCNDQKHDKNFRDFLKHKPEAVEEIEKYMISKNYKPLTNDKSLKIILDLAHKEVADLAIRYITIINEKLVKNDRSN
jgi:5-methylcytosine-specific restriction endonuclease McrA